MTEQPAHAIRGWGATAAGCGTESRRASGSSKGAPASGRAEGVEAVREDRHVNPWEAKEGRVGGYMSQQWDDDDRLGE